MISVVMPSYNSAEFIERAIASVLAQTFPHFELLVCDDGSSDQTLQIVERLMSQDDRVRLLRNNCRDISRNCNLAMARAQHPWIARLDADDIMLPTRLELQARAVERDPDVVLWGGYARLVNRRGKPLRTLRTGPTTREEFEKLRRSGSLILIQGPTVMFRRDLALRLGGYDRVFNSAEDLELLHRLVAFGPALVLPIPLTDYRVHGASITSGRAAHQNRLIRYIMARDRAKLVGRSMCGPEEFMRDLDSAPAHLRLLEWFDERSRQNYRNASVHHAEGRHLLAGLCLIKAIALNPFFSAPRLRRRLSGAALRRSRKVLRIFVNQSREEMHEDVR